MRRRRAMLVLASWLACGSWFGCNAILGNESAVFEPASALSETGAADGGRSDGPVSGDGPIVIPDGANPDAGPCVNITANPSHCGACFHDCLGGECFSGVCQPITLATDDGDLLSVTVDATHAYWGNKTSGDIMRVGIANKIKERIYDGPSNTAPGTSFGVFGGHVYFAQANPDGGPGGLVRCPVTGCAGGPEVLVNGLDTPDFVSVSSAGTVLFTEFGGRIGRCTAPCIGAFETIASGENLPLRAAAAGDTVAWTTLDVAKGGVVRAKIGNDAPFDVTKNAGAFGVAIAGEEILYTRLGAGPRAILRDGGGPTRAINKGSGLQTTYFVVDTGLIYFANPQTVGDVYRCPLSGCIDGGAPLASNQAKPNGIAVDATSVYWSGDGTIKRVAK